MRKNPSRKPLLPLLGLAASVLLAGCVVDEPRRPGVDYGYVGGGFASGYSQPYDDGYSYGSPYYYGGPYYGSAYAYPYGFTGTVIYTERNHYHSAPAYPHNDRHDGHWSRDRDNQHDNRWDRDRPTRPDREVSRPGDRNRNDRNGSPSRPRENAGRDERPATPPRGLLNPQRREAPPSAPRQTPRSAPDRDDSKARWRRG